MYDFVYIRGTNPEGVEETEEIIRTKDLLKVVKWHDSAESKLCFESWDPIRKCRMRYVKDYKSRFVRDMAFNRYLMALCGSDRGCWDK